MTSKLDAFIVILLLFVGICQFVAPHPLGAAGWLIAAAYKIILTIENPYL